MPRALIKKYLPTPARIKSIKPLRAVAKWINHPLLWKINHRTISRATAIGLFSAYMPIPFEMVLAAYLTWVWKGYLPLSIALVWLSNPFTWLLVYAPPYLLGAMLLDAPTLSLSHMAMDTTMLFITDHLGALWLGCLIFGISLGASGFFLSRVIWKVLVIKRWENRHKR